MKWIPKSIVWIIFLYLCLPVVGTVIYSFATTWHRTVVPEGWTLDAYVTLFTDGAFWEALGRTGLLAGGTVLIACLVVLPALLFILVYYPNYERFVQVLVLGVYAFPGIILAVGLLRSYNGTGVPMLLVLVGTYVISVVPFLYQSLKNAMSSFDPRALNDAAQLLGASRWQAFRYVILPSVKSGLFVGALLSFSALVGEFVLINLVVGSTFETVQMYLMKKMRASGHLASAVVVVYLVAIIGMTGFASWMMRAKQKEGVKSSG